MEKIGLADKEAKVFLASLELGSSAVQEIAKKADINRATTYVIIEKLMKKGLMSSVEKGKKTFFQTEDPKRLLKLLEEQEESLKRKEEEFKKYLPELETLFNIAEEKPKVRFFEGKEGLIAIQDEFLKTKDKLIESISPTDELLQIFPNHPSEYSSRRINKKIFARLIYTSSRGPFLPAKDDKALREAKFIPKEKFPILSDIAIFDDRVSISSLSGKLVGVIIDSKAIAQTLKSLFYLAWEAADKYKE